MTTKKKATNSFRDLFVEYMIDPRHEHSFKGWIGDMKLVYIFFLIVPTLVAFVMKYVSVQVCGQFHTLLVASAYNMACTGGVGSLINAFNWIIPLWMLGAAAAALVYAAFLKSSPILFGVGLIYMMVDVYAAFYLSNAFYSVVNTAPLNTVAGTFSQPLFLIDYLPVILGVLLVIYIVVGITKWRSGSFTTVGAPQW